MTLLSTKLTSILHQIISVDIDFIHINFFWLCVDIYCNWLSVYFMFDLYFASWHCHSFLSFERKAAQGMPRIPAPMLCCGLSIINTLADKNENILNIVQQKMSDRHNWDIKMRQRCTAKLYSTRYASKRKTLFYLPLFTAVSKIVIRSRMRLHRERLTQR